MIRKCVICGREFSTPPSNNKITCSGDCSLIRKADSHRGKSNKWGPEAVARARQRAKEHPSITEALSRGTAAALKLPEGQRGPQNREAKVWVLISPEGVPQEVVNLLDWARRHAEDYFGVEATDKNAHNIASGIRQVKRAQEGKFLRNGKPATVSSYKGWQLLSCREKDTPTK